MDEDFQSGSDAGNLEMSRLWRTWRTVFEMLQDRVRPSTQDQRKTTNKQTTQGYEVTEDEVKMPLAEFKTRYSNPLGYPECVLNHENTLQTEPRNKLTRQTAVPN